MLKSFLQKIKVKISKSSIIKNAFSVFYIQTIASLIGLLNTFLLLKAIGVGGIGTIALLTTYINFYIGVFNFYSFNAIIKFGQEALVHNDILGLKKYLKRALRLDTFSAFATLIIAYFLIDFTSHFFDINTHTQKYITLYLCLIPFSILRSITAILRLNNDYKSEPLVGVIMAFIKMSIILLGLYNSFTIEYYLISEVLLSIMGSLILGFFGYRCLKEMNCLDFYKVTLTPDSEFTRFNIYNNLASTLNLPIGQLTNFIINKLLGLDAVGTFNIISKFGGIFNQIISAVTQSLLPALSRLVALKKQKLAFGLIRKTFITMLLAGVVASIIFLLSYPFWLHYFIPATFHNGILLSIYTLYMATVGAVAGIHLLFTSLNLVRYNIFLVIICNSVYIILLLLLPIKLGLLGVVISLGIQTVMMASLKYFIMVKKVDMH